MALSVIGLQPQIPAANTFQPGGSDALKRPPEEDRRPDATRPSGSEAARSERLENRTEDRAERRAESASRTEESRSSSSSSRGTTLDITV